MTVGDVLNKTFRCIKYLSFDMPKEMIGDGLEIMKNNPKKTLAIGALAISGNLMMGENPNGAQILFEDDTVLMDSLSKTDKDCLEIASASYYSTNMLTVKEREDNALKSCGLERPKKPKI